MTNAPSASAPVAVPVAAPPPAGASTAAATAEPRGLRRWLALAVLLVAPFMAVFDQFVVNVAIPTMQRDLGASFAEIQFVIAGYSLAYAVFLITGGRLGDVAGRKRLYLLGLAGFTLASALCGLAPTPPLLIGARLLQGLAAALLGPQVLAIIQVTFPPRERSTPLGLYSATVGLASVSGQVLGGLLIRADLFGLGWRTVFLVNLPIGLAALVAAAVLLRESRAPAAPRLDLGGVAIVTAGLILLLYPLVAGRDAGWPAWAWACLLATAPLLALFVRFERWKTARDGSPLIDLDLFRDRPFVVGLLVLLLFGAANAAFFLVTALYLQLGRGFSALTAGATFAWAAFGVFVAAMLSVRLAPRLGARLIAFGLVAKALAWLTMATLVARAGVTLPPAALVPALFAEGFGAGCTVAPLIGAILAGTRADHVGAASGVLTTVQQVAVAVGVALIGIVFFATLAGHARAVGPALAPDLRRQLAATGAGPAAVDATVADFVVCVAERGAARDPAVAPPSCARPTLRPADPARAALVATALAQANAATYARAFAVAMSANAGALALALLLLRFLPAPRSPARD